MNYENLPVYKVTFDLLLFVYRNTTRMQREYRYTLAEETKRALQEVLVAIYRANLTAEKLPHIEEARRELVRVRTLFRLMRELKQLSKGQQALVVEGIAEISKQLAAWEKYVKKNKEGERGE